MPDAIERSIEIDAPLERVWRLVTEPGWWIPSDQPVGEREPGAVTVRECDGCYYPVEVIAVDPRRYASFRWASTNAGRDPAAGLVDGQTTLVEFRLEALDASVRVTVTESGFAALDATADERERGYASNDEGWTSELARLKTRVEELADA